MLESLIGYHCGPALAGIKPSNIVSCYKEKIPEVVSQVRRLNHQLNRKDIYLDILCDCEKRVLIMIYRKEKLEQYLMKKDINAFLQSSGYPKNFSVESYINLLRLRLQKEDFPHEIGAFLGYPLHDIYGFIHHKENGCLLTGEWKVYKDKEKAKQLFSRYTACRKAILRHVCSGKTLAEMFCTA